MRRLVWKVKVWGGKLQRIALRNMFKFDKWHLFTLTEKQYAQDIITYCNKRETRNRLAEIGCGLGDIVRHVHYREREGYDLDKNALKAAAFMSRFASGTPILFAEFKFPETPLPGRYDIIILVNWIHHIEPLLLQSSLARYFDSNLNKGGAIIVDTVQDREYRFNHEIGFLTEGLGSEIEKIGDYERQRQIWAIKK